jgi:lambda repressor-like predicted transcriptional regulator
VHASPHSSPHSSRVRGSSRLALVLTLAVVSVGSLCGVASAVPGAELWAKRYDGRASKSDVANAIAVSPDGSQVFVTGSSKGSTSGDNYATVAYDTSTGSEQWAQRYNGRANDTDVAAAIGVSPDGSTVFVTGYSYGASTGANYLTLAYDSSDGAELWVAKYDGPPSRGDIATALGVSPDGSAVFVTGYSVGSTNGENYATVAYDAVTGAEIWIGRYNAPANSDDEANDIGVSPDGSAVFVTGFSYGSTSAANYATVAYAASDGTELWVKRYDGPSSSTDVANALGVSPDGSAVFVTGASASRANDYATVAYNASTGAELWVTRYNGPSSSTNWADALDVSPDGSQVFVTGYSYALSTALDFATIAYDASNGQQLWLRRYGGPSTTNEVAYALEVSPDGNKVFVTGFGYRSSTRTDYATVAYRASNGVELWLERYDGRASSYDDAYALAVDPGGSQVFVTGSSTGRTSGKDYATVAYSIV